MPHAVAAQAAALHRDGKFAEAEALLRDAIAAHPDDFDLRHLRGVMLAALKRHREAPRRLSAIVAPLRARAAPIRCSTAISEPR